MTITSIVNSIEELAAFPLSGNVAFFVSDGIDNINDRITVFKTNTVYPDSSSYLGSQLGKDEKEKIPEYSITFNETTKKVIVAFLKLEPSTNYTISINFAILYGQISSVVSTGLAKVVTKKTINNNITTIKVEVLSDSSFDSSTNSFTTKFKITYNSTLIEIVDINHLSGYRNNGILFDISNDMFLSGDNIEFYFNQDSQELVETISIKTFENQNITQILDNQSKTVNELDLIQFYEDEKTPISPIQPNSINRILKSANSILINFKNEINLNSLNITTAIGPAFNNLNIPEEDWNVNVSLDLRLLSPNTLLIKIKQSTGGNEIIKHV